MPLDRFSTGKIRVLQWVGLHVDAWWNGVRGWLGRGSERGGLGCRGLLVERLPGGEGMRFARFCRWMDSEEGGHEMVSKFHIERACRGFQCILSESARCPGLLARFIMKQITKSPPPRDYRSCYSSVTNHDFRMTKFFSDVVSGIYVSVYLRDIGSGTLCWHLVKGICEVLYMKQICADQIQVIICDSARKAERYPL